jgi:hypothetical protein
LTRRTATGDVLGDPSGHPDATGENEMSDERAPVTRTDRAEGPDELGGSGRTAHIASPSRDEVGVGDGTRSTAEGRALSLEPAAGKGAESEDVPVIWEQITPPDEIPTPPEEIVGAARMAPEHYFYMPDPNWSGDGVPPEWAVIGRWRSDDRGEIADWEYNEKYRPSPEALGWREPADEVDEAVQFAVTGYGPTEAVPEAMAAASLHVFLDQEGNPALREGPEETTVVPVFTMTPDLRKTDLPPHRHTPVIDLLGSLTEGQQLMYLSPTSPVTMVVPTDALLQAARTTGPETVWEADEDSPGLRPPTVGSEPFGTEGPTARKTDEASTPSSDTAPATPRTTASGAAGSDSSGDPAAQGTPAEADSDGVG